MSAPVVSGLLISIGAVPAFTGMHLLFPTRFSLSRVIPAEAGAYLIAFAIYLLFQGLPVMVPFSLCCLCFLCAEMILFQGSWQKKLLAGGLFLISFGVALRFVSASLPVPITAISVDQFIPYSLVLLFTVFLMDSTIVISMKGIYRVNGRSTIHYIWFLYLLFPVCQFLLIDRTLIARNDASNPDRIIFLLLSVILSLAADIALIYSLDSISSGIALQAKEETLNREVALQSHYYQQVAKYYDHLRKLRHDLSNHLYSLRIQIQDGRLTEAMQYAKHLRQETKLSDHRNFCEHPVADLFLVQAADSLAEKQIALEADLDLPSNLQVSNSDLICVLGTLIDRSVSYAKPGDAHRIRLSSSCSADTLSIRCAASCLADPAESSMSDSILRRIADRYHGTFVSAALQGLATDEITLHTEVSS